MPLGPRALLYDASGNLIDVADGVAIPAGTGGFLAYGTDAGVARRFLVDASGRQLVAGAGANAAAIVGNPVRIAGSDGSLTRDILTDSLGRLIGVGTGPSGSDVSDTFPAAIARGVIANAVVGSRNGFIVTAAVTEVAVRGTGFTEQASGVQRSFSSTSAADTAAGTGARTIRLTYYVQVGNGAMTGPFTETITLNGVTSVNTVATNIRLVEKIEVLTVGSGAVNAGIIQMFAAAAAAGGLIASIGVSQRQTYYTHHYVPTGKTCYITGQYQGSTAGAGNVPNFKIRSLNMGAANSCEAVLADSIYVGGSSSAPQINFSVPLVIVGPARVVTYVSPANVASQSNTANFSFYEL